MNFELIFASSPKLAAHEPTNESYFVRQYKMLLQAKLFRRISLAAFQIMLIHSHTHFRTAQRVVNCIVLVTEIKRIEMVSNALT